MPEPSKDTADASTSPVSWKLRAVLKALAVVAVVAVLAVPVRLAVIVPAEKLPEASRATIAELVLADVQ